MKLTLVRHTWGVDHRHGLLHYLPDWLETGYSALEACLHLSPAPDALREFLRVSGFRWIPQVFSHGATPWAGTVADHLRVLRQQIEACLPLNPWFFNAHSGSDAWSPAEAVDFYGEALQLEREIGIAICHETHRKRYFYNPWNTAALLRQFPGLKLTADFSHWVCVAERLLPDAGEELLLAARHCYHLHARLGHEQSPQVPDPRDPRWSAHLATFESWWDLVWREQRARGDAESSLCPEFGPFPYQTLLPHTGTPVADLAEICDWMARRQSARFHGSAPSAASNTKSP